MYIKIFITGLFCCLLLLLLPVDSMAQKRTAGKIKVLFDTDANNELDDQHAMAYLSAFTRFMRQLLQDAFGTCMVIQFPMRTLED